MFRRALFASSLTFAFVMTGCATIPANPTVAAVPATAEAAAVSGFAPVKPGEVDAGMTYDIPTVPVTNSRSLSGKRIAILAAHGFEEVELTYPLKFLKDRGAQVDVISPDWIKGRVMAVKFLKPSVWIPVAKPLSAANPADYQAVIVPGGAWNPIIMRTDEAALNFVRTSFRSGKLVASLCHGPQVLLSAGILKGLDVTGVGDIRTDLANAGARVVSDKSVVVSRNVLTSRDPHDLADFSKGIETYLTRR